MSKTRAQQDFEAELQFHRREWRIQRIGWMSMLAFIAAAALGYFGDGPLSSRRVGDARTATLEYERFIRYASPTLLELSVAQHRAGLLVVEVNEAYLQNFEIKSIVPSPRAAKLVGDHYRFEFDLEEAPATIALRITPEKIGGQHGAVVVAGTRLDFSQFVYP